MKIRNISLGNLIAYFIPFSLLLLVFAEWFGFSQTGCVLQAVGKSAHQIEPLCGKPALFVLIVLSLVVVRMLWALRAKKTK